MSCSHCAARVEKALNRIDGIEAKVDLESRTATLHMSKEISDDTIFQAIDDMGYSVTEITGTPEC